MPLDALACCGRDHQIEKLKADKCFVLPPLGLKKQRGRAIEKSYVVWVAIWSQSSQYGVPNRFPYSPTIRRSRVGEQKMKQMIVFWVLVAAACEIQVIFDLVIKRALC